MKTSKILLGVLAGAVAGTVVGMLYAPEKGSQTRRQILDKGDDYAEGLKNKLEALVVSLNKKYQSTLVEVEGIVTKGKNKYENALQEVDGLMANANSKLEDHKNN
ncbi:MAG: YtxH domain-containing protein [Bacteroidota bacterium]